MVGLASVPVVFAIFVARRDGRRKYSVTQYVDKGFGRGKPPEEVHSPTSGGFRKPETGKPHNGWKKQAKSLQQHTFSFVRGLRQLLQEVAA